MRTYVTPFDAVGIREALLREAIGRQSFIIVPRIADLPDLEAYLNETVPVKFVTAHGQMAGGELKPQNAYDGQYDVLLSTSIGWRADIPSANAIVVPYRYVRIGAAYQMRGRVGRSKLVYGVATMKTMV